MYRTDKYYSKNANGKIMFWQGLVDDTGTIDIMTGQLNSDKLRRIRNENVVPKGNRSKMQQAINELKAKANKKEKDGYKTVTQLGIFGSQSNDIYTILDKVLTVNKTDANNVLKPMKAVQWKNSTRKYPMICQPKINGHRNIAMPIIDVGHMFANNEVRIKLLTKSGHEYILPHISDYMPMEWFDGNTTFDGEVYVHGEKISQIKKRLPILKIGKTKADRNSLPSEPVLFYIFDLNMYDMSQIERLDTKDIILKDVTQLYYCIISNTYRLEHNINSNTNQAIESPIVNVRATIIHSDEEAMIHLLAALASGFEGVVLRDLDAEYMFGGRRNNMIKLKKLIHGEFVILDVILKNEDSTRTYIGFKCKNDINDLIFDVTAQGTEEDRQDYINNPDKYIGKRVTLGFGERTINDIPFHIEEVNIRETWDLDEKDLQIEV